MMDCIYSLHFKFQSITTIGESAHTLTLVHDFRLLRITLFSCRGVLGSKRRYSAVPVLNLAPIATAMSRYADLSRDELIARLEAVDTPGASSSQQTLPSRRRYDPNTHRNGRPRIEKPFDFTVQPTRHIALLLTYHGWPYSGLAIQSDPNLTTVEGELLKALEKTHLIEHGKGFEGCSYSRCGRTDRGVSGEGQVVDLYVRSCRKGGKGWRASEKEEVVVENQDVEAAEGVEGPDGKKPTKPKKEPETEFSYPRLLNGVLPPSIRVVAWSPVDEDFNSRFSCTYRHYKYPFHLDSSLDLSKMREAAESLVGEHDFRNFCKLDGSKQIENHSRRVVRAYFDEEEAEGMVVFNLIGTAFLWHQVRHVIAALFLVGRGLEDVALIKQLLDTEKNPSKPTYNMGDPLPLTLQECGYPEPLDWRIGGYDGPFASLSSEEQKSVWPKAMAGRDKLERELVAMKQHSEFRTWQIGGALRTLQKIMPEPEGEDRKGVVSYPVGGGEVILTGKYKKVMDRQRGETPEVVNRKWKEAKERRVGAAAAAGVESAGVKDEE